MTLDTQPVRGGWLLILPTKLERLSGGKRSSLLGPFISYEEISFIRLTPGSNLLKLFTVVIYECTKQAKVFAAGKSHCTVYLRFQLEKLAVDKRSSLFGIFASDEEKKLCHFLQEFRGLPFAVIFRLSLSLSFGLSFLLQPQISKHLAGWRTLVDVYGLNICCFKRLYLTYLGSVLHLGD